MYFYLKFLARVRIFLCIIIGLYLFVNSLEALAKIEEKPLDLEPFQSVIDGLVAKLLSEAADGKSNNVIPYNRIQEAIRELQNRLPAMDNSQKVQFDGEVIRRIRGAGGKIGDFFPSGNEILRSHLFDLDESRSGLSHEEREPIVIVTMPTNIKDLSTFVFPRTAVPVDHTFIFVPTLGMDEKNLTNPIIPSPLPTQEKIEAVNNETLRLFFVVPICSMPNTFTISLTADQAEMIIKYGKPVLIAGACVGIVALAASEIASYGTDTPLAGPALAGLIAFVFAIDSQPKIVHKKDGRDLISFKYKGEKHILECLEKENSFECNEPQG